jgi:hypothetical protein
VWLVGRSRSTWVARQHASNGNAFGNGAFATVEAAAEAAEARTFLEQYEILKSAPAIGYSAARKYENAMKQTGGGETL